MLAEVPYDEWSATLDAVAEELLWESGVSEPPVDAFYLAIELGLMVTEDLQLPARAQFSRVACGSSETPQPTIVLGDEDRFERRQFAVAHELGEFAAVRVFERLAIDPRSSPFGSREQVANGLAGRLLLPRRWFHKQGIETDWDLLALKDVFWTASHELLARRMLDMPPRVLITVCDQGEVSWRRGNNGLVDPGLLAAEHDAWQECHVWDTPTSRQCSLPQGGAATIRCWPVHEPLWRREIIRTDIEAWE